MLTVPPTPIDDGTTVLLPGPGDLPGVLAEAERRLARMPFDVAGVPAGTLRRQGRAELRAAIGGEVPGPWIVTGHQSQMHHAGVWFKDAVAAAAAHAAGGSAIHLVADHDTVTHAALAIPRSGADGRLRLTEAPYASPSPGQCPAQLPPPAPTEVEALIAAVPAALREGETFARWGRSARSAAGAGGTLAEWVAAARSAVNASLHLAVADAFISRIVAGGAFARFAADVILRHEQMLAVHNDALAAHRAACCIRNRTQPVPELKTVDGATEVPLWVYRRAGPREALLARTRGGGLELRTPAGPLADCPADPDAVAAAIADLAADGVAVTPRALTLTMFARTFLADLFVHGTGGARYERFGDELTERWFSWRPPAFVTATATLRLPLPSFDVTAADAARARSRRHRAWHNPHLYARGKLPAPAARHAAAKADTLAQLAAAPRGGPARAARFAELHRINAELRRHLPSVAADAEATVADLAARLAHNAVAAGREFFFALQPPERLAELAARARTWAAGLTGRDE